MHMMPVEKTKCALRLLLVILQPELPQQDFSDNAVKNHSCGGTKEEPMTLDTDQH